MINNTHLSICLYVINKRVYVIFFYAVDKCFILILSEESMSFPQVDSLIPNARLSLFTYNEHIDNIPAAAISFHSYL